MVVLMLLGTFAGRIRVLLLFLCTYMCVASGVSYSDGRAVILFRDSKLFKIYMNLREKTFVVRCL